MRRKTYSTIILLVLLPLLSLAQEESATVYIAGKRYLDINVNAKEKLNQKISRQQEKLLKKLKKKEAKYASTLKHKDSAAYVRYQHQPLTYDSIARLQKNDTAIVYKRNQSRSSPTIDSLKGVKQFLEDKAHVTGEEKNTVSLSEYDQRLQHIKNDQDKQHTINELIQQRTDRLKSLGANKSKIKGLTAIQKQVFYSKGKMAAYQQMSDNPSKAEEKALEILQGQEGFEGYLKNSSTTSNADMGQIAAQNRKVLEEHLKKKFGNGLPDIQQNMTAQIKDFDKYTKGINNAEGNITQAKQSKQTIQRVKKFQKPKTPFKINPMRSQPLSRRIEKQLNYQTTRPTADGKPAIFQLGASAGFKHTPSLTYGLGVSLATGLGQGWSEVKFSFQGVGLRSYAAWKWQYGFGGYAGYERTYKQAAFTNKAEKISSGPYNTHNKKNWNESVLIGITKSYRISNKWSGGVQLLYEVWWKDKQLQSPIQLRFTTAKS